MAQATKTSAKPRNLTKAEERRLRAFLVEALGEPDADCGWSNEVIMDKVGAMDCFYCPLDSLDDQHPADDPFDLAHLPWSEKRKEAILSREAKPTSREWKQWRRAAAAAVVRSSNAPVGLKIVYIKDINPKGPADVVAVFGGYHDGAAEDGIGLWSLYPTKQAAVEKLAREGVLEQIHA